VTNGITLPLFARCHHCNTNGFLWTVMNLITAVEHCVVNTVLEGSLNSVTDLMSTALLMSVVLTLCTLSCEVEHYHQKCSTRYSYENSHLYSEYSYSTLYSYSYSYSSVKYSYSYLYSWLLYSYSSVKYSYSYLCSKLLYSKHSWLSLVVYTLCVVGVLLLMLLGR